jgi:hypothetical protein
MGKARSPLGERQKTGGDAQNVVRMFRVLTEEQFDYWIACLNRAIGMMGGAEETFTRDDRQKTISYWYLLMFLLEIYSERENPFAVGRDATWFSHDLVSMKTLSGDFSDRYKEETIRRYVFDLKQAELIALKGRGGEASVQLAAPTIVALTDTIRQWVKTFRAVDKRISKIREFG